MSNIITITDFSDPSLDFYARLSERQLAHIYEPCTGLFIAESPKVIHRALDDGYEPVSLLVETKHLTGEAKDLLPRLTDIPVYTADFSVLTQLTGYQLTRGALCVMKRKQLPDLATICSGKKRIAILEDVVNPTNVGAIFRSAAALNMEAVILTSACSDPLYRRSLRVSMGTVFQVPWTILPAALSNSLQNESSVDVSSHEPNYIDALQSLGFQTAAMALDDNSVSIDHPALAQTDKLAIILGTEGEGLTKQTIAACDFTVKIPMAHGVDSLNVAAASAVAFWELGKHTK